MSALLDACALTGLQQAVTGLMTDTATVTRPTPTRDASGGLSDTYGAVGTTPIQLYRPASRENALLAGEVGDAQVQMMGKVPVGTDVRLRDRLTVGSVVYEVVLVLLDPTIITARRVALVRFQ